ncbi:hypothetical protein A5787_07140 [Mycobacterium sp. 852002-50816_SCH5313054-b]|nr:hypothetical protein A5787_07140 [Mycobacterium sp. 852002-50816_SCH5313054-b]
MVFLALLKAGDEIVHGMTLVMGRQLCPLATQILCVLFLLLLLRSPMRGTGSQSGRRLRPPGADELRRVFPRRQVSSHQIS